jgi:hypothetical protein
MSLIRDMAKASKSRVKALPPSPRNVNKMRSVFWTSYPGDPGMKIGLVLKKIEMSPGLLHGIMGLALPRVFPLTEGAGKGLPFLEVQVDVNFPCLLVQSDFSDIPGLSKVENSFKKRLQLVHGGNLPRGLKVNFTPILADSRA